jgi:hypothetical protein
MHKKDETAFEFQEQPAGEFEFQEQVMEVEEDVGGFIGMEDDVRDKTEVLVFTTNHMIRGKIALVPGARLTDYMVDAKGFIAMIEVEVKDKAGKLILQSPFLNVNRDLIELILPAELAII